MVASTEHRPTRVDLDLDLVAPALALALALDFLIVYAICFFFPPTKKNFFPNNTFTFSCF